MSPTTLKSIGAPDSRESLIAAACDAFARDGFEGASIDAIARRCGVNKAMIYYHFQNKLALYLEIVRAGFAAIGDRVEIIVKSRSNAEEKLVAFIAAVTAETDQRPYLAPVMTREMADGARRLDPTTLREMHRVFLGLRQVLAQGLREGVFREVDPFFAFQSVISPIIYFRTTQPLRAAMSHNNIVEGAEPLDRDLFLAHHTSTVCRALATDALTARRNEPRARKSR